LREKSTNWKIINATTLSTCLSVRELEGKRTSAMNSVLDKNGIKHADPVTVLEIWEDHFKVHLNKDVPHDPNALHNIPEPQPYTCLSIHLYCRR